MAVRSAGRSFKIIPFFFFFSRGKPPFRRTLLAVSILVRISQLFSLRRSELATSREPRPFTIPPTRNQRLRPAEQITQVHSDPTRFRLISGRRPREPRGAWPFQREPCRASIH